MEMNIKLTVIRTLRYCGKAQLFFIFLAGGILSHGDSIAGSSLTKSGFHRQCNSCHIQQNNTFATPLWNPDIRRGDLQPDNYNNPRPAIASSKVCLSCHDGTIGSDQAISLGGQAANTIAIDPDRSHPVSVDYSVSFSRKRGGLRHPSTLDGVRLYDGKVECATCHDIHASSRLRASKRALCTSCHNV